MKYILHNEGMITMGSTPEYQYHIKDHLGNNRLTINSSETIVDQAAFYPFRMLMTDKYNGGINNKYLYNGKELQDDVIAGGKLGWYDYGARMYDGAIGRFYTMDPLAEEYYSLSPYGYVAGNPIIARDENGEWVNIIVGAVVGGVVDAAYQYATTGEVNMYQVGISAVAGGLGGYASIATKGTRLIMAANTTIAAAESVTKQMVETDDFGDFKGVDNICVENTVDDILGSLVGEGVGELLGKGMKKLPGIRNAQNSADRAASRLAKTERKAANGVRYAQESLNSDKINSVATEAVVAIKTSPSNAAGNTTGNIVQDVLKRDNEDEE